MERETGLEPATSSLGRCRKVENKSQLRLLRSVLTNQIRRVFHDFFELSSIGVNGVTAGILCEHSSDQTFRSPLDRHSTAASGGEKATRCHTRVLHEN